MGSFLSLPVSADGLGWLGLILGYPPSVAWLWRLFPGSLSGTCRLALVGLQCIWIPWSCGVPGLHVRSPVSGRVCVLPQSAIVTLLSLLWVGLNFGLIAGTLPQADAVGFGLRWSGRLSSLFTGRACSLDLGSSSLDLVGGGGFHCVPSPLSSFGMWSPFGVNSVFCHY